MSPCQRVVTRAAETRQRVPSLAASQSARGACPGRGAVDEGSRSRGRHLGMPGAWSGPRPRCWDPRCARPCVEPSGAREARRALLGRGAPRRLLGRVDGRVTPKADPPGAHGACVRQCHRSDVAGSLASRIWAARQAPHPRHRRACLGSRCSRRYGQAGMDPGVRCHCGCLRAGARLCTAIVHPLGD